MRSDFRETKAQRKGHRSLRTPMRRGAQVWHRKVRVNGRDVLFFGPPCREITLTPEEEAETLRRHQKVT